MQNDDGDSSSLSIYKFRRKIDRPDLSINPTAIGRFSEVQSHNILIELDGQKRQRTYAILQEPRPDFHSNRLRYVLLIYTNSMWNLFILSTIFFAYFLETCLYTFNRPHERSIWFIVLVLFLNAVFTIDVAIVFGLKFFEKWRKTLNLVEPDTKRVILDAVLALPYSFVYFMKPQEYTPFSYHAVAPIMATIRVYKIIEYSYSKSSRAGTNQWTTFLAQYLILFLLAVHTWTCIWYLFAHKHFDIHEIRSSWSVATVKLPTETTFDWYFVGAYWSVLFFTTNSLGDIYPVTTYERIVAAIAILLGFLLTTVVFVGSLTSLFITITTRRAKYVRQLKKIQNHLSLIKMDPETTKRIIRYYEDLWYQKSGVFKPKLMKLLPAPLQMEIFYDLNAVPLYSSLIFRKLPEAFLRRLSVKMTHQFYLPGDIVYNHNQNKTIMICVTSGVLELLSDEDDESPMISFAKGTCFGEISLVYNIPARCTVKAATYVECQVLSKTDFIKLMITYPDIVAKIRKELQERIYRSHCRKQKQGNDNQLTLNIYASKDRKKSSIKCLKDKLRYIQGFSDIENFTKDDELDENCLDLYILSEHVKKRTTAFTCLTSNFPWILESDCYLVKYWQLYMLSIVFYVCLLYPYFIGFKREFPRGIFFYIEIVITISLVLNVFITIVTSVKTKKRYIRNFLSILNYRMYTLGFYMDVFAIIPFEYIVTIHTNASYLDNYRNHLFYLCKGTKLCLVWRLSSFFDELERKLLANTIIVKIVKYCVYIGFICYWSGVILYMESCFVSRCSKNSWFASALTWENQRSGVTSSKTKYHILTATYFATTTLLSVGYGDFTPGDQFDMEFVAFLSLYGVLLTGYCVSEFSAVVTHWSRTKTAFLEVIITMDRFMKENNMHSAIKSRIMSFYELQWQYNSGVELTGENWLERTVVPSELRKKVLHQARFRTLTSIRFFQVKNKAYIHTLTETARDIILPPGEIVYYGGTVTRDLYIIESGYCMVTSKEMRETKRERVIGPGNHLGLLVLLYGVPAVSTVITLTHCKLISISHFAYTSALNLFPDMREHDGLLLPEELKKIEQIAKSQNTDAYLKHYNLLTEKRNKKRITNMLQDFFNNSFINVLEDYRKRKEKYLKSYKQFHVFNNLSPYLLMPIAIKPDGVFIKIWAILRVCAAYLLSLLIPIVIATAPTCKLFNIAIVVLECFCYVDLYLMLHVAFYGHKNQLIYHPYLTARNYLRRTFVVDLLTCFPWYALWKLFVPKHNEGHTLDDHQANAHMYHCIIRMVNVLQIYKLYAAFWAESIGALKRAYLMSVVQFLLLTLFFLNLYTSILMTMTCRYVVAYDNDDFVTKLEKLSLAGPYMKTTYNLRGNMICKQGSWIDGSKIFTDNYLSPDKVYLLAYYWTAASFTGAGFGDITAQDTSHMLLSICINIHGVLFFGYVYARIASLKAMADQVVTTFQENLKHLELFLNREKVPYLLKKSVIDYWKYQWKRTGGWSHQKILGKLHANLNEDAVLYMYEKTLREIPLFEDVEYSFFRAFAKKLKERYFQKGYMVMRSNEVISNMYIIYRGKVDIISNINEVEACMGPGGIFGNIRGASKYLTMSNVMASRNTDLLCIEGSDFYSLLKSYPTVLRKVKYSVDTTTKDYVLPTVMSEKCSMEIETYPLTYEADEDDDEEIDPNIFLDSPDDKSVAESHGSRSITSGDYADYISAIWLLFKPHRWFRSSVVPDSTWLTFIDYLIMALSYMDFLILVYQMAFLSNAYFFYMCVVFDIIFLYKAFLDMHSGYMNRYGDYVLNPKKVRKMYFSKVYLRRRDFLVNLPISYLAFSMTLRPSVQHALFCYLRTPQLFRISYLFTYRQHRTINIGSANLFLKLTTIAIWASLLSHVNACLFFKLSCLTPVHCTSANWISKEELNLRGNYAEVS
ncbi:uncharacterized protein LOC120627130 isoform X2 [Pararge aegeria]|uniref:uncharacterized protein LOC120627130 isoform X2 n=1 Tax=Pararge aegeria TaxID=116150 RepID=UPI0019D21E1D|nr:uncharacterized protein LOC120627130 isoform X2 [Pararge aegeria]